MRLWERSHRPGDLNWLLFPGPGIGSESLEDLADSLDVLGATWLVHLPGDGSNFGREMLARISYNAAAIDWSDANFDHVYKARWWPRAIPVLRLTGSDDRIVRQGDWDQPRFDMPFDTPNLLTRIIDGSRHFPWIENSAHVREAFNDLAGRVVGRN